MDEGWRGLARKRILGALDELVAQFTAQADLFGRQDAAAPVLITEGVVGWVERLSLALARYGEGEYARAAGLADITGIDDRPPTTDDRPPTTDGRP